MTDDEMSEFAEMLADACNASPVLVGDGGACPMAAAVREKYIGAKDAADRLGIPYPVALGFANGFDGYRFLGGGGMHRDRRAYDLGRLFRELYP